MGRAALGTKTKITIICGLVVVIAAFAWWGIASNIRKPVAQATSLTSSTARLSYDGQNGQTALALLKKHAQVQTKNSSLGEYVTSINGQDGGGKKYWIFYVNGKEAQIGAGAYVTHNNDKIEWRLQ